MANNEKTSPQRPIDTLNDDEINLLEEQIIAALKEVYDPEIPVNIYDLGLIYAIQITDHASVSIQMTLTAPGCPVAQTFPGVVENAVLNVAGVRDVTVELVWDPPWEQSMMSEAAKVQLGIGF